MLRRSPLLSMRAALISATVLSVGLLACVSGSSTAAESTENAGATGHAQIDPAIQKVYPALVRIYVVSEEPSGGRMEREQAAGSGAVISPEGYIVTNHHVAGNATRITCTMSDGEEVEAVKVGTDPLADIAVIKLKLETRRHPERPLVVATWGDSDRLKVGDVVLAMGSPMAVSQSVTRGIVSNTQLIMPRAMAGYFRLDGEDVGQIVRWIGHDAVIFGGNSGGPLVNLQGEIIGINEIGLGSLGGAIPSNLAKEVVRQLIENGRVARSWLGLEFQPRLKSDKNERGVLVSGVIADSPADRAGIRAGDLVTRLGDRTVSAELPEHLPLVNQLVFALPIGKPVEIGYLRDGKEHKVQVTTDSLQHALGNPAELKAWGMAVRDITRMMALERHRPNTRGVLIDSIRGGSGAATAKLPLQPEDIIVKVAGHDVPNAAALRRITEELIADRTERVPVLVCFERDTEQFLTVVKIGKDEDRNRPASANKPWSAMSTQVLTSDLAESLGLAGRRGVRVTEVFKGQAADRAGVRVGDVIHTIGGRRIEASLPGDREVFDTMIRRLPLGGTAALGIVRDGKPIVVKMMLEAPPINGENVERWSDADFEFGACEMTYPDLRSMKIPEGLRGVLLQKVEPGGWASLGGLRGGDFLMRIGDTPTPNVAELRAIMEKIREEKPRRIVFHVRRGIHTLFCEIEPDYR